MQIEQQPNNKKKDYVPNFTDKRVIKRIKKALGFTLAMLSTDKPRQMSKEGYLDKVFGKQGNDLTDYLRSKCLKCVDNHYRFVSKSGSYQSLKSKHKFSFNDDANYCKTYVQNVEGINEVMMSVGVDVLLNSMQTSKRHSYFNKNSISSNAYYATSFDGLELARIKHELSMTSALEVFGPMFKSKVIPYKDKADRLWNPAQNLSKDVKQPLHLECGYAYEYDIECCAPTLLLQYARRNGLKTAAIIDFYLDNKTEVRNVLSSKHNIPVDIVKVVITALFSGARIDKSVADKINDRESLNSFRTDPFVIALQRDISKLWRTLKPVMGQQFNKEGFTTNRLSSSAKWKVYYQLERQVLNSVIDYLSKTKNDVALEHDGWTTSKKIDTDELIKEIQSSTGYLVRLSEVKLEDVCLMAWYS